MNALEDGEGGWPVGYEKKIQVNICVLISRGPVRSCALLNAGRIAHVYELGIEQVEDIPFDGDGEGK